MDGHEFEDETRDEGHPPAEESAEPEPTSVDDAEPLPDSSDDVAAVVASLADGEETPPETGEEPVTAAPETPETPATMETSEVQESQPETQVAPADVTEELEAAESSEPTPSVPGLGAADTALPDLAAARRGPEVPWWPYLLYLAAWIALVAVTILSIAYEPDALPAYQQRMYPFIVIGGLALALLGPLLSFGVWLAVWMRAQKGERGGLLTSALVKGAGVTLFGSLAWYATVVAVDALRLGIIG